MTHIATMPNQTIWDCRWSQPGYRLRGVAEVRQPESFWVCLRKARLPATDPICEQCPHWEADDIKECP
jgi:hypothetical protein